MRKSLSKASLSKKVLPWIALSVLTWLVWLFSRSSEFGECIRQQKESQAYRSLHEEPFFIVAVWVRFHLNSTCTAHALNAYGSAVAALAGVVVAGFTGTLWWSTEKMWHLSYQQRTADNLARVEEARRNKEALDISKASSEAAIESNKISRQSMASANRAWVYFTVDVNDSELIWSKEGGAEFKCVIVPVNHGRSPALNVEITARMTYIWQGKKISDVIQEVCRPSHPGMTYALFQKGSSFEVEYGLAMRRDEIEVYKREFREVYKTPDHPVTYTVFHLAVGIAYQIVGDDGWHHTAEVFRIGQRAVADTGVLYCKNLFAETDFPKGTIMLQTELGGQYAN